MQHLQYYGIEETSSMHSVTFEWLLNQDLRQWHVHSLSHLICHEVVHMREHCNESPSSHQIGAQIVDVHIIACACHDGQQRSVWLAGASKHGPDQLLHRACLGHH